MMILPGTGGGSEGGSSEGSGGLGGLGGQGRLDGIKPLFDTLQRTLSPPVHEGKRIM